MPPVTLVEISQLIGFTGLLCLAARVIFAALGRLRLVDWFLFVAAAAGVIAFPLRMFDVVGAWSAVPIVVGLIWGLVWAVRDVRGYREDPRREPLGAFIVGRVPDGVRNWVGTREDRALLGSHR